MSTHPVTRIRCGLCPNSISFEMSVASAKEEAHEFGWIVNRQADSQGEDYCPRCKDSPKVKLNEIQKRIYLREESGFSLSDFHSKECNEGHNKKEKERKEWTNKWLNHCKSCEGAGGFYHPGTQYEPPDFDLCVCVETNNCPRCGEIMSADDKCINCGWNSIDPDAMPSPHECFCQEFSPCPCCP